MTDTPLQKRRHFSLCHSLGRLSALCPPGTPALSGWVLRSTCIFLLPELEKPSPTFALSVKRRAFVGHP